ncbi:murein DD-endopeptidase MepM/ murein hydrolase activator NlpD [Chromohalobacter marismortui]|uniref:Murein DD-endopeptidase MepM/ murein hydrolase activator NlpD n=1 Tax=Chromohalobacter marismortui TaxID=42055 RepID=A0A4R7NLB5_9GAMM|nr:MULTISPECIES: peptidoglycan DD-metalloendopeptidase family protein [Chromohalobacter]MCI0510118.1 peptidoglycan DD-metalloendopeptidase family protein [Chromohalobacter sp.]MCI0594829.1 peptidoglycan DD-metalloendopeptidase family protein [Chromohalobacter sp.]TDU21533.1 murein DD-endopeptidase MepM/ murein hydrolase activator NlpD [Chromohalobacter marismortui]
MSDSRRLLPVLGFVVLGLAGCVSSGGAPQVQDLSVSRNSSPPSTYTVKSGDTLYGIAWQNNLDFRDLAHLNDITPPYRIEPGQTLRLTPASPPEGASSASASGTSPAEATAAVTTPLGDASASSGGSDDDWLVPAESSVSSTPGAGGVAADTQAVAAASQVGGNAPGPVYDTPDANVASTDESKDTRKASDTSAASDGSDQAPADKASRPDDERGATGSESSAADSGESDAGTRVAGENDTTTDRSQREYQPVESVAWQWPAKGEVINGFDDESSVTAGIDIAGEKGQPVRAAGPGIVVYAGSGVRGYGNLIILKHNDHFLSAYAHNDSLRVKENDVVEAGDVIATMGDTDADRVKLHFEVRQDGQPQDPMEYLPPR